jgi:predicted metalloprotease with PDZ domain
MRLSASAFFAIAVTASALIVPAFAQAQTPAISLSVNATDAPRRILHAQMSIPVQPGELTLVYPKWIPGEHGPTGPIVDFTGLKFTASGQPVKWTRDSVDMFAFHLTVPAGTTQLNATADFLATAGASGFSAGASTSANLMLLSWNELVLYPQGKNAADVTVQPSLTLPAGWKYGTALTTTGSTGNTQNFAPVSLEQLVDSPVLAGLYFKEIPLAPDATPKHFLDLAADGPEDLAIKPDMQAAFDNLVRETGALYKSRHYHDYHFLVTLSDEVAHFGLEHHQSSDDRVPEKTFLDDNLALLSADLLPHEFTHSWNGKYRRPAGLATPNYQEPMKGDLLWVYEGMTQYWGDVLSARSGIQSAEQYKGYLAASAANLNARPGRTWRDLQDTATAAQLLYEASPEYDNWRRGVDYYAEGELLWLDADTLIREKSKGKRSLNDFAAKFLAAGGDLAPDQAPKVLPYTFDDVVATLNQVEPYDWAKFLRDRLDSNAAPAPLDGITRGGYQLEYADAENEYERAAEIVGRGVNAWYSLGLKIGGDGSINDVLVGGPAAQAGFGPGMSIVAINNRKFSSDLLHQALHDSKTATTPMEFIVENTGYFKVLKIDYHGGEKYPQLVKVGDKPSSLDEILQPLAKPAKEKKK